MKIASIQEKFDNKMKAVIQPNHFPYIHGPEDIETYWNQICNDEWRGIKTAIAYDEKGNVEGLYIA